MFIRLSLFMLVQCKHVRTYYKAAVTVHLAQKSAAPTIRGCSVGSFGFRFAFAFEFQFSIPPSGFEHNYRLISFSEFRFSGSFRARLEIVSS